MRICLIGKFSGNLDEGMKNVAFHLAQSLAARHEVLSLDLDLLVSGTFWQRARDFAPEVIHCVPGPSMLSLMVAKALSIYCFDARVVISALHPFFPLYSWKLVPFVRPYLVLVQSRETESLFSALSCRTEFLPVGINTKKFVPVSQSIKEKLREKYHLGKDRFVILHVGHLKKSRNLHLLAEMQGGRNQVIIVASTSTKMDKEIYKSLTKKGCLIWRKYFPDLEEIYALSDCYIFPVLDPVACIEWPLSVMEAMACNLPVISTRFGALSRAFDEGRGLIFIQQEQELFTAVEKIKQGIQVNTREKVLPYSWENVIEKLEDFYAGIIL